MPQSLSLASSALLREVRPRWNVSRKTHGTERENNISRISASSRLSLVVRSKRIKLPLHSSTALYALSFDAIGETISRSIMIGILAHREVTDLKIAPLRINQVFLCALFNTDRRSILDNSLSDSLSTSICRSVIFARSAHKSQGHAFISEMERDVFAFF